MKKVRRISAFLVFLMSCIIFFPAISSAKNNIVVCPDISVYINGEQEYFHNVVIALNGSILLPLEEMLENLGVPNDNEHIIWNNSNNSITIIKDSTKIYLKQGSTDASINGKPIKLSVAPIVYDENERTYIPVRFVAEALGNEIAWDQVTKSIYIRDSIEYKKTKEILDKAISKMNSLDKLSISYTSDNFTNTKNIELDRKNKVTHIFSQFDHDIYGNLFARYESYTKNGVSYIVKEWKDLESNPRPIWIKQTQPKLSYNHDVLGYMYDEVIYPRDVLYAGLTLEDDDYYFNLRGHIYPLIRYLAKDKRNYELNYNEPNTKYETGSMFISIDKNNNYIRKIRSTSTREIQDKPYYNELYYSYGNSSEDFQINIPEEALKAPEGEIE